ncbi:MAG: alpha/beta fold hydrolase [Pseudomonadota bacterium]
MLATTVTGAGDPPLLIVHGLFGSARNWGAIARRMGTTRRVLSVDMRNHGQSFRADTMTYTDMAADLAEVIEAHGGRADVIGHSMGGKAAMMLALSRPDLVRGLVVADIAPVAYGHSQLHYVEAMQAVDLNAIDSRGDADAALAGRVPDPAIRGFLLQSLDVKARRWLLNLPVLAAEMPTIVGWPGSTASFDRAVLFLTGGASDYVLPEHRPVIRTLFPAVRMAKLPGAGHWLHAEQPQAFAASSEAYFAALDT